MDARGVGPVCGNGLRGFGPVDGQRERPTLLMQAAARWRSRRSRQLQTRCCALSPAGIDWCAPGHRGPLACHWFRSNWAPDCRCSAGWCSCCCLRRLPRVPPVLWQASGAPVLPVAEGGSAVAVGVGASGGAGQAPLRGRQTLTPPRERELRCWALALPERPGPAPGV